MLNNCQLKKLSPCCPLCDSNQTELFHQDTARPYFTCQSCYLVFVPKAFHLSPELERAEYDKHQNDPDDEGYQKFLGRTVRPLLKQLSEKSQGLDFGCGPGPCISQMLKNHRIKVTNYDPYYFNQPKILDIQYDFITMTEVIEHVSTPQTVLTSLKKALKTNGILAIMTKRVISQQAFSHWHYKNDPTHICFYSTTTFEWIAAQYDWELEIIDKDVVFFHNH